jgi:hypothetical protein
LPHANPIRHSMTTTLIGISGSVRAASFNAALLRVAAAQ